jgi:DNA repair protein RecN (Recombination protein N)
LRKLSEEERVIEIAKMLSGEKPGNAALQNAKELIDL